MAHEAIVEALRTHSRFDSDRGSLKGWLLGIARHEAIDAVGRRRGEQLLSANGWAELIESHSASQEVADPQWTDRQLLGIARSLPVDQREILALRHVLGRSFAEIAEQLGKSAGAARASEFEARQTLRVRYESATAAEPAESRHAARYPAVRRARLSPVLRARRAWAFC